MSRLSPADARLPQRPQPAGDASLRRRVLPREVSLSRLAIDWLAELPGNVRPRELVVRFPHVANNLAAFWHERELACDCFDSLIRDRRGGRRGFPPSVAHELTVLKQHHEALLRRPQRYNWNDSIVR